MSKSASLPIQPFEPESNEAATPAWKQEVNQKLAAHRNRRVGPEVQDSRAGERLRPAAGPATGRAAEAAARVAARYAKAPSYSQLLAGEARAVVRAAGAAAEAALNAQAAAEAVLAGLESGPMASGRWDSSHASTSISPMAASSAARSEAYVEVHAAPARWLDEPPARPTAEPQVQPEPEPQVSPQAAIRSAAQRTPWVGAQPRWEETLPAHAPEAGRDVWSEMRVHSHGPVTLADEGDLFAEDSYDSLDPVGSTTVEPVTHLPANLIEFPRELVATRKARPRLAEGPLYDNPHESSQLNIFEVDPELLAPPLYLGESTGAVAPPEWASIELDHRQPAVEAEGHTSYADHVYANPAPMEAVAYEEISEMPGNAEILAELETLATVIAPVERAEPSAPALTSLPQVELLVAQMSDRLLASVVDGALVTLAFLAAAVVVIASTDHPPTGRIAAVASGVGFLLFAMLYQFLFLSYAEEGTPGMRYARIALCTFEDDNPSRKQMQMRIPALLLSAIPAGLGVLWAIFDGDHLALHDRLTRTYQRKY